MTIYNFLLELKSFPDAGVTNQDLKDFKDASIKVPIELLEGWQNGDYDEDPNILVQELTTLPF